MRLIAAAIATAVLAVASAPAVASERVSDATYLTAAKCQGLAHASQLGAMDTGAIDAFMKTQGRMRDSIVRDRGEAVRKSALRSARSDDARQRLVAQRDSLCAAFKSPTQIAAGSGGSAGAQ
jgi:hypothetical protein